MFLTFRKLLKIMRNDHKLYLKVDIYYWSVCFKRLEKNLQIGLDYAYYLSSPGYSWDVMLKLTDVNLKLNFKIKKGKRTFLNTILQKTIKFL